MKQTKVSLAIANSGEKFEFDVEHAERILAIRNSGWVLPEDSQFELKDGSITRRDKGKAK